jgi:hypothetical protein
MHAKPTRKNSESLDSRFTPRGWIRNGMTDNGPLDLIPICGVILATVVAVLLSFEGGLRVEQYWRRR